MLVSRAQFYTSNRWLKRIIGQMRPLPKVQEQERRSRRAGRHHSNELVEFDRITFTVLTRDESLRVAPPVRVRGGRVRATRSSHATRSPLQGCCEEVGPAVAAETSKTGQPETPCDWSAVFCVPNDLQSLSAPSPRAPSKGKVYKIKSFVSKRPSGIRRQAEFRREKKIGRMEILCSTYLKYWIISGIKTCVKASWREWKRQDFLFQCWIVCH